MTKAVLIRISTQEVIKKANYPSKYIEPIPSLEDDLEWLIVNELARPVFDASIEKLERVEEITTEAHPIYTTLNQYKVFYNIIPLTQAEIDAYNLQQEDNDQYGTKQSIRQGAGQEMTRRFFAFIHRQVGLSNLTNARAVKASNYMLTGLTFLNFGEMELAKNSFNAIDLSSETAANQTALQTVIDLGILKVQTYLDNE